MVIFILRTFIALFLASLRIHAGHDSLSPRLIVIPANPPQLSETSTTTMPGMHLRRHDTPSDHATPTTTIPTGMALLALTPIPKKKRLRRRKTPQQQALRNYNYAPLKQKYNFLQKPKITKEAESKGVRVGLRVDTEYGENDD